MKGYEPLTRGYVKQKLKQIPHALFGTYHPTKLPHPTHQRRP